MATWVEDIIQALRHLGGQATLKQIYVEVKRSRKEPLSTNWHASIRERIEAHSSDSKNFKGKDLFRKVEKGSWALRDHVHTVQSSQSVLVHNKPAIQNFLPPESFEEISNILRTIKQYRDYQNPDSPSWKEYVKEFFHILGFSTEELNPRFVTLNVMGASHIPKAIVGFILPGENFDDIIPGLQWESHLFFAANYYQIEWGILTNGLQLKIINFKGHELQQTSYWSDLDGIIRNEKLDTFCTIYKVFSFIRGNKGESTDKRGRQLKKSDGGNENDLAERHVRRLEFWRQLLEKAKTKTKIHARISPGKENWISAGAGKSGLAYSYVVRMEDAQVELYIDRKNAGLNKKWFETLYQCKDEIEGLFGASLEWQALEEKRASRIRYLINDYGLLDKEHWPELQNQLIEAMIRFEKAFRPFIQQID